MNRFHSLIVVGLLSFSSFAFASQALDSLKSGNCSSWASSSRQPTLLITFEGLASHNSRVTKKVYSNFEKSKKGQKVDAVSGGSGFMGRGLMNPLVTKYPYGYEFLLLSQTWSNGRLDQIVKCISDWKRVRGQRMRLVLSGHSNGGDAAFRLTQLLRKKKIKVDGLLTVDPLPKIGTYGSSTHMRNFKQPIDSVGVHVNFHVNGNRLANLEFADVNKVVKASHVRAPFKPEVLKALKGMIGAKK